MFPRTLSIGLFVLIFLAVVSPIHAQNVAYRQRNLASDVTAAEFTEHINPLLQGPWGIAAVPQKFFLIANSKNSRVATEDAKGNSVRPSAFVVPDVAGPAEATVTGVVVDSNRAFAGADSNQLAFAAITATAHGGITFWGVDTQGNFPSNAVLKAGNSQSGAVYTSLAILSPSGSAAKLAVADFHNATIQLFDTSFAPAGTLRDPALPAGFAPFGMQVIGNQLFVTFAPQDAAKLNPVPGGGNGIVSIFDLSGRFVRRFATSGPLDDPWGVAQAGAEFGPFANAILIGNTGDGVINAFDSTTGNFLGRLEDGDGHPIRNSHLRGLILGSPAFGDANTLYFVAGINGDQDGLFGSLTPGLVSVTQASVPTLTIGKSGAISVTVSAGPGNAGTPTGSVRISDGPTVLGDVRLTDGSGSLDVTFDGTGSHALTVRYGGDAVFLPSTSQLDVSVNGLPTLVALEAPASSSLGAAITLTATVHSDDGIATGQVAFDDGGTTIGTAPLNASGVAVLRTNSLAAGTHSLTARYEGDGKFAGSTSPAVTTDVVGPDFSLVANRATATAAVGQPAQFVLTITPSRGFNDNVSFSCAVVAGVTCSFAPPSIAPGSGSATTTLSVTVSPSSASAPLVPVTFGGWTLLAVSAALLFFVRLRVPLWRIQPVRLLAASAALVVICAMPMMLAGCGGSGGNSVSNHKTAIVQVTASGRTVSHTTTVRVTVE